MTDWLKIETDADMAEVRRETEEAQREFLDSVPWRLAHDILTELGVAATPDFVSQLAGRLQQIFSAAIAESWVAFDAAQEARRIAAMH